MVRVLWVNRGEDSGETKMVDWRLHVLIDPRQVPYTHLAVFCKEVAQGGATVIQLRGKDSTARDLMDYGTSLRHLTRQYGLLLITNDRVDLALALDADGVHVGQDDIPISSVRRIAPRLLVGASAGTIEELSASIQDGPPDYWGIGPVYSTRSKGDAGPALGITQFSLLCQMAQRVAPVVAIGGISGANAFHVWQSGADGIAVISAVAMASQPGDACREILAGRH